MLQKSNMQQTEEIFFMNPTREHYLMNISREINLSHTSVKKNLDQLVKLGLISKVIIKRGKRKFPVYKADTDSKEFRKAKIIYNLSAMFESRLVEFLEEKLAPKSIVLFGSFLRGEDVEDSDIDLFIECEGKKVDLKSFEKRLSRKINIHFNDNFNIYADELKQNIINGMILFGFLEVSLR